MILASDFALDLGPWMVASIGFAALLAIGAWGTEWWMMSLGRARRHVWSAALAASVVWPIVAWLVLSRPGMASDAAKGVLTQRVSTLPIAPIAESPVSAAPLMTMGITLLIAWVLLSLLLAFGAWRAHRALTQACRAAAPDDMHGVSVLRTKALGPAVVGLHRAAVVIPEWVWELDTALQRLVVQHELEHRRAGDPWLVWAAVAATTLMPWNPAVWWMARRLRLAMEVDCDTRTLQMLPDARPHYARLLLLIAHHRQRARFAPMLVPSSSQLARRIDAMMVPHSRSIAKRTLAGLVVAVAALAACSRHIANNLAGPATPMASQTPTPTDSLIASTVADTAGGPALVRTGTTYFDFQTEKPATLKPGTKGPSYPKAMRDRGVQGVTLAQFVVNESGQVEPSTFKVLRSDGVEFSEAVRAAIESMAFDPALIGGQPVRQLVQMPFEFQLPDAVTNVVKAARVQKAPAVASQAPARSPVPASGNAPSTARFDFQTQQPAKMLPDSPGPIYPTTLRDQGVEGTVIAQFVVDSAGMVLPGSFRVLRSDHEEFTKAVRDAMPTMRFSPARIDGRAVRQLLQEPFEFKVRR